MTDLPGEDRFPRERADDGHRRAELDLPGRSFRYVTVMNSFVIVYESADDGIRVVSLLRGARNLARDAGDEG